MQTVQNRVSKMCRIQFDHRWLIWRRHSARVVVFDLKLLVLVELSLTLSKKGILMIKT